MPRPVVSFAEAVRTASRVAAGVPVATPLLVQAAIPAEATKKRPRPDPKSSGGSGDAQADGDYDDKGGEDEDVVVHPDADGIPFPRKRYFRQRAHSNPLADVHFTYPLSPAHIDWARLYPAFFPESTATATPVFPVPETTAMLNIRRTAPDPASSAAVAASSSPPGLNVAPAAEVEPRQVTYVDVGCGYGGLTVALAEAFPTKLTLAMEIRDQVTSFVAQRINYWRAAQPGHYQNAAVVRANSMKTMPCFFRKAQLEKLFFLFPDPHFKKAKRKWRVISRPLLDDYAYCLQVGGLAYTLTDVDDLHAWMVGRFDEHPLFERVPDADLARDPCVPLVLWTTEEGRKEDKQRLLAVYRRIPPPS